MAKKTIFIAAPHGIILNAAAMDVKADIHVGPHEPVEVPLAYGEHLIADRFAIEVDAPKADDKASVKKAAAEKVAADKAAAEKAVAEAEAAVAAASDDAAKVEAEKNLAAARAALDALKV